MSPYNVPGNLLDLRALSALTHQNRMEYHKFLDVIRLNMLGFKEGVGLKEGVPRIYDRYIKQSQAKASR